MEYILTLLAVIIGCCLYETFKPYRSMWDYCVVRYPAKKIEKIRFQRQFRDLEKQNKEMKFIIQAKERNQIFMEQWRDRHGD